MFSKKFNLKTIFILVLFISSLILGVCIVAQEMDKVYLAIIVTKDYKAIPNVNIYIFATAPNGTRFIKATSTNEHGIATITLSIKDVIKPLIDWNEAEKRSIKLHPVLYITAIGKYEGYKYFGVESTELPLTAIGPLKANVIVELTDKLTKVEEKLGTIITEQQAPPWARLIYSKEESKRETLFKVVTDQHTRATAYYEVTKYGIVGFKCTFSVTLYPTNNIIIPWKIGKEITVISNSESNEVTFSVGQNSVGYVSCLVTCTYECWEYEEPANGGEVYREHRVYIRYHLPETLMAVKGDDDIEGTEIYLKSAAGKGWNTPATGVNLEGDVSMSFAIPVFGFVINIPQQYLPIPLKIPIDVALVIKTGYAVRASVHIFGEEGYTVYVYYIEVRRTVNAYYNFPTWAIVLKT
ncbi:MAG: hypothetical protein QXE38_01070 [Candidatus Methanomethylicia archaeon]